MIVNLILGIFSLYYLIITLYLHKGWRALPVSKSEQETRTTRVSILIAARNEEKHIANTIQDILSQDYPKALMEVIVVDDHSTDNTAQIIRSFSDQGVHLIQLKENKPLNSYKKLAITQAIKRSTGELLVATDADCRMGPGWLGTLVSVYQKENAQLISAPVVYEGERNWFELLQTLEFLFLIGLGAAGIGNKRPSTCNGANLAYRREVFDELNGFEGIDHIASGDDELFLHKVAEKYRDRVVFCKSFEAIVYTQAKETLSGFLSQRKRWASKSVHYKNKSIVRLGVSIWLFNVVILAYAVLVAFLPQLWVYLLAAVILKLIAELIFMAPLCRFVRRPGLIAFLPLLSVIHVFYMTFIGVAGNWGTYQWKGRKVH